MNTNNKNNNTSGNSTFVSKQAIKRIPFYLNYLKAAVIDGKQSISAPVIAKALNLNEVLVRKDLAAISRHGGKPKIGYDISDLILDIEDFLGYENVDEAVLVGAGHLGKALLSYRRFEEYGLEIVAAFDSDPGIVGSEIHGKKVFAAERITDLTSRLSVRIGIITVPAEEAQSVCDKLVEAGVLAIWNFAPVHLIVPANIMVQNEDMAESLAILSRYLSEKVNG